MLFNSYPFLFVFLPAVLAGFSLVLRFCPRLAIPFLGAASLAFYGGWNPAYLILMCASIVFNFGVGEAMHDAIHVANPRRQRRLLTLGIVFNLAALGYFKYAGFVLGVVGSASGVEFSLPDAVLPLGISFFTFTQIAFLVDTWRDPPSRRDFPSYLLFVTFFPHLIAGPIYHHKEMLPQYAKLSTYRISSRDLAVGSTIFMLGLFKKTMFADSVAPYADHVYAAAAAGTVPNAIDAWGGTLAYALQIYFDFSGYSDMAIGLARLFGIALPLNFASPYKARSIVDFWRRWHMSLSRFLRDYLYVPLGGNRRGEMRTQINLGITMLLGGLWHGANWTFVAWGAMHGAMLMLNHGWRRARRADGVEAPAGAMSRALSVALTFVCVLFAWVLFRAESLSDAWNVYRGMMGAGAQAVSYGLQLQYSGAAWCLLLLAIAWFAPNTQQIMGRFNTAFPTYPEAATATFDDAWWSKFAWQPNATWAMVMALVSVTALVAMSASSQFLYFQF